MKKFKKLAAVFAALMLALSCFVACSNGDDDDDSADALQGHWVNDDEGIGLYFVGNTMYFTNLYGNTYYYIDTDNEHHKVSFSVSGDKIVAGGEDASFKISGNTATITTEDGPLSLKKIDTPPTKTTESELEKMFSDETATKNCQ